MRIAFGQTGELGGIQSRIHASENRKVACGRHGKLRLVPKVRGIFLVGGKYFFENIAHRLLLDVFRVRSKNCVERVAATDESEMGGLAANAESAFSGSYTSNRIGGRNR